LGRTLTAPPYDIEDEDISGFARAVWVIELVIASFLTNPVGVLTVTNQSYLFMVLKQPIRFKMNEITAAKYENKSFMHTFVSLLIV
jgi:hypothetical protein